MADVIHQYDRNNPELTECGRLCSGVKAVSGSPSIVDCEACKEAWQK